MAFQLLINEVDYTDYYVRTSIQISEALQANAASMSLELAIDAGVIAVPLGGHEIRFYRDSVLEFAGRISTLTAQMNQTPDSILYSLTCVDFTVDLDRRMIQTIIPSQLLGDVFRSVVGIVGYGFTSIGVVDGPTVAEREVNLEAPSALLSNAAEAVEYQWYVNYERDVQLFYIRDLPAPRSDIDFDVDIDVAELIVDEDWTNVKNVLYLTGGKAKSGQGYTQTFFPEGDNKFFPLAYPPWDEFSIAVTIDAVPQEILLDNIAGQPGDGQGASGQVYVCLDNEGVRLPDSVVAGSPGNPADVEITYDYGYDVTIKIEDPVSIARMMEIEDTATAPSDGVHEAVFTIPDFRVVDENSIWEYGRLLLIRYSSVRITITFESKLQGWSRGQSFRGYSTRRALDYVWYIQSVTKIPYESVSSSRFKYTVVASNIPFPG